MAGLETPDLDPILEERSTEYFTVTMHGEVGEDVFILPTALGIGNQNPQPNLDCEAMDS